jgi:hypothetical protein
MCLLFTRRIPFYSVKEELVNFVGVHIPRKGLDVGIGVGVNSGAIEIVHILRKLVGKIDEIVLETLDVTWSRFAEFDD